ncbi:hypothetical protein ACFWC9_38365 [Streptomyces goshikiensis]|uniref:hypothetical protein n=1 Tax=Streptomyces goshikiensis TaxID=1942 RepID=UPI003682F98F
MTPDVEHVYAAWVKVVAAGLLTEAYRHGKAIGGWNGAERLLASAGITADEPGIAVGETSTAMVEELTQALGEHRAWDRFPANL